MSESFWNIFIVTIIVLMVTRGFKMTFEVFVANFNQNFSPIFLQILWW